MSVIKQIRRLLRYLPTSPQRMERYKEEARDYIRRKYVEPRPKPTEPEQSRPRPAGESPAGDGYIRYSVADHFRGFENEPRMKNAYLNRDYRSMGAILDEIKNQTFVEKVNEILIEKNMANIHVYKAAQIDRRLFSRIMSDVNSRPSKDTALAMAFGMELTLRQAEDLLKRAGYSLSHSDKRDIVMEYFFMEGIYKMDDINQILDDLGLKPLGRTPA